MQYLLFITSFFVCQSLFGQSSLLSTSLNWFTKADKASIQSYLESHNYQLIGEKDSLNLHFQQYSFAKSQNEIQLHACLFLGDSTIEYLSFEITNHADLTSIRSQLKANRFRTLNADLNGDFITTTFDTDRFLVQQDYQAIENPLGKGEIPYYRFRIFRKHGKFDTMNGEKISFSEDGTKISENYKNGLLDGERTFYFSNGTLKRKENFRAGRLNGLVSDFNEEGKLIHSSTHSYHWKYGMEKWYNHQGKMVKSLQWQRDVPIGIQKQTFEGIVIEQIPYVKGIKQGLAKVPYFDEASIKANFPRSTLNDEPLGIETVNFVNDLKQGKAVCIYFNKKDTMYVGYYKSGKLDSTYSLYRQNGILYSTTFSNGLENGTRIYRIPSGPLKDSIHRIQNYKNGKLEGILTQYYRKEADQTIEDPDPHIRLPGDISIYPIFIPGPWLPNYYSFTYRDGIKNGPYSYQMDSMNYGRGTYLNDRLEGYYEAQVFSDGQPGKIIDDVLMIPEKKWVKSSGYYQNGLKTKEWTTNHVLDSIVITEHFEKNQKHGSVIKTIKGFKTEERFYHQDTLQQLTFFGKNQEIDSYQLEFIKNTHLAIITHKIQKQDSSFLFSYLIEVDDYYRKDTLLGAIVSTLKNNQSEMSQKLNGLFHVKTSSYETSGNYRNGKLDGIILTKHFDSSIFENITYRNGIIEGYSYTQFDDQELYTGAFISATSGEHISVKDGLRHGWCVEYLDSKEEIRRTKYMKGVLKKTVEK
ncbi:toxin-antitoxin system YwqK family antitoxin [Fluviicola taffensis]|uniref:MORN variant repeat-containing protein n=1 Tax=Fluviicola taffensis (strain DSM 16823 / NCIMB 13979 / RW262) TaxID=755732 RepID=F2IGB7_FLUTR|nr:hypothetical protein [Fluviicola taffensis]AEA45783.1 hypothetical protein Fluta_3817 [Fluviicola taffensis DSM 16823]